MDEGERTWNNQGLTSHDENDSHGTEIPHAEPLAEVDGEAQLNDEHGTEDTDADCQGDVGRALKPYNGVRASCTHDEHRILNHQCKAKANCQQGDYAQCTHEGMAIAATEVCTHNLDLEQQGRFNADQLKRRDYGAQDGVGVCGCRHSGVVARKISVEAHERRGEKDGLTDGTTDVAEHGGGIQGKHGRATLLGSS